MKLLVLHGPNLNLLGERPGDAPGLTLATLDAELQRRAGELGATLRVLQSNHEGALVDALHRERHWADGVILNPGALAHTSYVLRDAIAAIRKPTYEVHLTDLRKREVWRRTSVLEDVRAGAIQGKGVGSYLEAMEALVGPKKTAPVAPVPVTKSIGRKRTPASPPAAVPGKTLGKKTLGRGAAALKAGDVLSRRILHDQIAARLSGKLAPEALAAWARARWDAVHAGAPVEAGQRGLIEETLQRLLLSQLKPSRLTEDQLIGLMTRLEP